MTPPPVLPPPFPPVFPPLVLVLALPPPQLKQINSKHAIAKEGATRFLLCPRERNKQTIASPSANARIRQPETGIVLKLRRGIPINCALVLAEGGSVFTVKLAVAGAPLLRFTDEAGLIVQVAPAISAALQFSPTLLLIPLSGLTVNPIEPDCPALIVRLGAALVMLKSGIVTLIISLELKEDA